ncbi:hypothetical protein [Streptacidiphilus carbonis]|jgi:hypothetical protein|uniref:hypothetical protein n=1 Tax=Streptacidiphilus carbonis TaxID=105422 RepID=UPI000AF81B28|nr:hypothetical protein [Streptacidiphilus carbonis]
MSKVKNRERKQQKTLATAAQPGQYAQDPAMENTEQMLMPSVSQPVSRKKEKRYGHN